MHTRPTKAFHCAVVFANYWLCSVRCMNWQCAHSLDSTRWCCLAIDCKVCKTTRKKKYRTILCCCCCVEHILKQGPAEIILMLTPNIVLLSIFFALSLLHTAYRHVCVVHVIRALRVRDELIKVSCHVLPPTDIALVGRGPAKWNKCLSRIDWEMG